MSDLKEKYRTLVDRLYQQTKAGAIDWDIDLINNLECHSKGYTIKLKSFRDEEGEPFEQIEIYNSDDLLVDSFSDGTLAGLKSEDFPSYFSKMQSLRNQARRLALGADKALDEILDDLDDIPF